MEKNSILNELARPDTLDGFMCSEIQREKFQSYIDDQDIPHIGLFSAGAGIGKTTLAKILAKNIDCDVLYLNATEDRSIDTIKEKVGGFASAGTFKAVKIVILDEATHILEAGQVLLLNMIETFSGNTRFILTGNYPERLIDPLRSRLQEFKIQPPEQKVVMRHVYDILNRENIKCSKRDVATIVKKEYPDLRKVFNTCQKFTINNELIISDFTEGNNEYQQPLLKALNNTNKKSVNEIKQILVNTNRNNFEDVYRFLYDSIDEYAPDNVGEVIITLEEGLSRAQTRLDSEVNIMASISRIIQIIS